MINSNESLAMLVCIDDFKSDTHNAIKNLVDKINTMLPLECELSYEESRKSSVNNPLGKIGKISWKKYYLIK
jgi:hypothetical protein